jgi:leucyl-tRNA synthetase
MTGHLLYSRFGINFRQRFCTNRRTIQKIDHQGMILGTSAFVYRLEGTNTFVSKNKMTEMYNQFILMFQMVNHR